MIGFDSIRVNEPWAFLARMRLHLLPVLLLVTIAAAHRPPDCISGLAGYVAAETCGDGVCDPGETMQSCPQDCGIVLVAEDFEDGQVQGWNYDPADMGDHSRGG